MTIVPAPPRPRRFVRWVIGLTAALMMALCAVPVLAFWVVPWADAAICMPRAAKNVGVPATYAAIRLYIIDHMKPGMTRGEVQTALIPLGSLEITSSDSGTDTMWINMCLVPFNNFTLFLHYKPDGHLNTFDFMYKI
jgi:hypothetical protein